MKEYRVGWLERESLESVELNDERSREKMFHWTSVGLDDIKGKWTSSWIRGWTPDERTNE